MTRTKEGRAGKADIAMALEDCAGRMDEMRASQERYAMGFVYEREANIRRGLRRFGEEHVAFLNAAYAVGDYLKRALCFSLA